MNKLEIVLSAICILIIIFIAIISILFIFEIKEMLNDYRCSQLPINEFYKDKQCKKYWKYR